MRTVSTEAHGNEHTEIVDGRRRRQRVDVIAVGEGGTILATPKMVNGYIELPGGGVDKGETFIEAAVREAMEEAGWTITDAKVLDIPGNWVYQADKGSWLKENGYDEEQNIVVVCKAVAFQPTSDYKIEGDARPHMLLPLAQVVQETLQSIQGTTKVGVRLISRMRLQAIQKLFGTQYVTTPIYTGW